MRCRAGHGKRPSCFLEVVSVCRALLATLQYGVMQVIREAVVPASLRFLLRVKCLATGKAMSALPGGLGLLPVASSPYLYWSTWDHGAAERGRPPPPAGT